MLQQDTAGSEPRPAGPNLIVPHSSIATGPPRAGGRIHSLPPLHAEAAAPELATAPELDGPGTVVDVASEEAKVYESHAQARAQAIAQFRSQRGIIEPLPEPEPEPDAEAGAVASRHATPVDPASLEESPPQPSIPVMHEPRPPSRTQRLQRSLRSASAYLKQLGHDIVFPAPFPVEPPSSNGREGGGTSRSRRNRAVPAVVHMQLQYTTRLALILRASVGCMALILFITFIMAVYSVSPGSVGTVNLASGAVQSEDLAAGAVTSAGLASGSVVTAAIASGAVTASKIAAGTITDAQLQSGAVTPSSIADGAVLTAKLQDNAVQGSKIASATLEARHLAAGAVQSSHLDLQSGLRVSAGTATFAQPISATTPSTGAIAITHGGLGVVGNAKFGDTVDMEGPVTITQGVSVAGSSSLQATTINGALQVTGDFTAGTAAISSLSVSGASTFVGDVTLALSAGGLTTTGSGDITTTGSGSIVTTGSGNIRTVAGDVIAGGDLSVGGLAYFNRGGVVTGTTTQSTPTLIVQDHSDFGGVGSGGAVSMQVGNPSASGATVLRGFGTTAGAMLLDAANGGMQVQAASSLSLSGTTVVTTASNVQLSGSSTVQVSATSSVSLTSAGNIRLQTAGGAVSATLGSTVDVSTTGLVQVSTASAVSVIATGGNIQLSASGASHHVRVDTDADIQLSAGARFFAESDFASIVATSSLRLKTAAAAGVEATGNSAQLDAPVGGNVKLAPGGGALTLGSGIVLAQAGGTITIPSAVVVGQGGVVVVINSGATSATLSSGGGTVYVDGSSTTTLGARRRLTLVSDGTDWYA